MIKISAFCDEAAEDLSGQIAALEENGICFADIRNIDGKNVADFTERDCALYAAEFRRAGIGISCIGSPLGKSQLSGDFSAVCGMAESLCRTAIAFKTDKIRIFSFYGAKGQFEAVADRLKALVSIAQKYGVTLLHENELGIYGERAEDVLRLSGIEGLGFVYDPANYVLVGEPIQEAERTVFLSKYIHIKDARYSGRDCPCGRRGWQSARAAVVRPKSDLDVGAALGRVRRLCRTDRQRAEAFGCLRFSAFGFSGGFECASSLAFRFGLSRNQGRMARQPDLTPAVRRTTPCKKTTGKRAQDTQREILCSFFHFVSAYLRTAHNFCHAASRKCASKNNRKNF